MRLRDINLLAINEVTNTKDKRIKAIHVPDSDRWSLRIQDTQLSDDGAYECQVTTDTQTATVVHLKVLGEWNDVVVVVHAQACRQSKAAVCKYAVAATLKSHSFFLLKWTTANI